MDRQKNFCVRYSWTISHKKEAKGSEKTKCMSLYPPGGCIPPKVGQPIPPPNAIEK